MDRFLGNLGGVIAGYAMVAAPVEGTFLSGLDPILDVVGSLSMIVFSGFFMYYGVRHLFKR